MHSVNVTPFHPLPLPICTVCSQQSAVFRVTEHYDGYDRTLLLCAWCFRHRGILWERFAVPVKVEPVDDHDEKSH